MRFGEQVVKTPQLADMISERQYPDPSIDLGDGEQLKKAATDFHFGTYHPIGTCALGAVLDGSCKVKGVQHLRVVDASIFPNHVSGNICSSVYAVAECAADIIKAEYGWL
jgi:choline dehydrogenase-like flavoprotein